jgi:hypothetical protein
MVSQRLYTQNDAIHHGLKGIKLTFTRSLPTWTVAFASLVTGGSLQQVGGSSPASPFQREGHPNTIECRTSCDRGFTHKQMETYTFSIYRKHTGADICFYSMERSGIANVHTHSRKRTLPSMEFSIESDATWVEHWDTTLLLIHFKKVISSNKEKDPKCGSTQNKCPIRPGGDQVPPFSRWGNASNMRLEKYPNFEVSKHL